MSETQGGSGWGGEKTVSTTLEGRLRDACFCCARSNDGASDRSLSPPFGGGARGGERGNSQGAWTPFSVVFCKGRAVRLDFPGASPHPPWPPLRKGGTRDCSEPGNARNKTGMNTQPVQTQLFISPGSGGRSARIG